MLARADVRIVIYFVDIFCFNLDNLMLFNI